MIYHSQKWHHMGLDAKKSVFGVSEQERRRPAYPSSLISAFVICFLERIISKLATCKVLYIWLVSVAEETGLSLSLSETQKTVFVAL